MMFSPPQYSLSSGEISPLLWQRRDYQRNQSGVKIANGWLPLKQGGMTRMPGTWRLGQTRDNQPGRLISFVFSAEDAVVLEMTAGWMRVWRYGVLVDDGGSPYELATPYDLAAIKRLKFFQSADVIYLADGVIPVQKLSRLALDNWTIAPVDFQNGPFEPGNTDEDISISASAPVSDVTTLTASAAVFGAADVGRLIMLTPVDDDVPLWVGNSGIAVGNRRRYDGQVYELIQDNGTTGPNPPTHRRGDVAVSAGVVWRWIAGGFGICRITAFTSATEVTADVVKPLPPAVISNGTWLWSLGAFSATTGYPNSIAQYKQRLWLGFTNSAPRRVWASTANALEDFEPSNLADGSFSYDITVGQNTSRGTWIEPGSRGLHIGALGEEFSSRAVNPNAGIGPTNIEFDRDSGIGSHDAQPIAPDGKPIFISKDKSRLFESKYAFSEDAIQPIELSVAADHIGALGYEGIVWQSSPLRLAWLPTTTGPLVCMAYDPSEKTLGWSRCSLAGGKALSACVSKDAAGEADQLFLIVERDGNHIVERQAEIAPGADVAADIENRGHLFSQQLTVVAPGAETLSVPTDWNDQTIYLYHETGTYGPLPVAGGEVSLPEDVSVIGGSVVAGLFDDTHLLRTLDLSIPNNDGVVDGRQKRATAATVTILNTSALQIRGVSHRANAPEVPTNWKDLIRRSIGESNASVVSGTTEVPLSTSVNQEVMMEFQPVGGAPATITGITPTVDLVESI